MHVIMRLAVGTSLISLLAACAGGNTTAPSTPPRATGSAITTNSGPTIPSGAVTVSGVITEAGRPLPGVNVNAWVGTNTIGYSYMYAHGPVLTDSSGGYRL